MPLLEVQDVSKTFKIPEVKRTTVREHVLGFFRPPQHRPLKALDRVSFSVEQGEMLGIMGGNGSGKSTLLKIISGIYQPDSGKVTIGATVTPILELGVGWNQELDAIDNVKLIGCVMGLTLGEVQRQLEGILDFAGVTAFAGLKLKHFSSGMASRLAYAVAFAAVRDVLVLDEVFAVGDAGFKAKCEERFLRLRAQGHTVIVVSHEPRTIAEFCTRAMLLDQGRVLSIGSGAEIAARYLIVSTGADLGAAV